jgi:superfamily I DNA/RNA helicase/Txe/YoeB family toxin of Txe-Axe toxin-antitoxin module
MSWALSFTPTFFNEQLNLPKAIQKKVSKVLKALEQDPISAQGDAKKLKGYHNNVYRVRLGDYRLVYSFGQGWVKLLSIRKRDERTYTSTVSGTDDTPPPPPTDAVLNPNHQAAPLPETGSDDPTTLDTSDLITTELPFTLTPQRLKQWQIPSDYWPAITAAPNSEALLELAMPDQYLQRIIDNLYPRPIAEIEQEREYVLPSSDDLERFVEGELTHFLLKLDPEQEKLKNFGKTGPVLVKGGAGTGKSTLALYRVQSLLEKGCKTILFTTYTKALVNYSEQLLSQLLAHPPAEVGVTVATVDSLAVRYYTQTHRKPQFARNEQCLKMLERAIAQAPIPGKNAFDREGRRQTLMRLGLSYLLQEFQDMIEGWGITTLADYLALERRGRGVPLQAKLREALWSIYETWLRLMTKAGLLTWSQLRMQALTAAQQQTPPPYDAIVIDEAQDLSPTALRFLLALTPSLENVYLTADASQSLYQRGFSWKQIHTDLKVTGRTLLLKRNYRNTEQILTACATILDGTTAGDPDCIHQEPSAHQGGIPQIRLTQDLKATGQAIQRFFGQAAKRHRLPIYGGAVLCPNSHQGRAIAMQLQQQGLATQFVSGNEIDLKAAQIKVMTLHAAKGLEFPFVVVIGLEDRILPYCPPDLPDDETPTLLDEQRRLFYVGCSRAMRALLVLGSQTHPSPFLTDFALPHWQRE